MTVQLVRTGHGGIDAIVEQELSGLFHVERLERRGPASRVYLAREVESDRVVALKVLPRSPGTAGGAAERFQAALAVAATLDHPHVIPVYRSGATSQLFWYTMKRVEGSSLDELLHRTGRMELQPCLRLVEQVAAALHYAHRRGVTHGNVKPANVMVGPEEWVLLGDFAVARAFDVGGPSGADALWGGGTSRLPPYLAPEEHQARQPGPGADQYALAVLVGECLQGTATFDPLQRLVGARPDVPAHVWDALARAKSREPGARFPTVLDLVAVLESGARAPIKTLPPMAAPSPAGSGNGNGKGKGRGSQPAVLLDDAYESAVRTSRAARLLRRVAIGAGGAVLLVAAAVSGIGLLERGTGGHSVAIVAPESWRSADPESAAAQTTGLSLPPVLPATVRESTGVPTTPVPATRPPVLQRSPSPQRARAAVAPGRLFVSATPWGELYIDGRLVGNTPKAELAIAAGRHQVRVVRDGFEPFEQTIQVPAGRDVRLTGIALQELRR